MSDFHDYKKIDSMDFNCAVDSRKEVFILLPQQWEDPTQSVINIIITDEGLVFDFYNDGEKVARMAQIYEDLLGDPNWESDKNELALIKSKLEHPTNWKINEENPL